MALRPHIQLEFTISTPELAPVERPVASLLAELKQEAPEVVLIKCVNPVEIAADKLSALVWRIPGEEGLEKPEKRSLVRHLHDLAALEGVAEETGDFGRLVLTALESDRERNKDLTSLSNQEKFNILVEILAKEDKKYREAYDTFVKGLSYAADVDVPGYDTAIAALQRLTALVLAV